MRVIKNSLFQSCHSFRFCRCTRVGWKRRCQGQWHVRCMSWRQSAVQRNSEREVRIGLWYYWKNNLAHGWNFTCPDVPFNLSSFVTILNTFSVSWITIPERPKRQGFLLRRTEVHNVSKDKIIAIVQTGHYRAMKISLQKFGMHTCRTWHSFCHCRGVGA